MKKLIRCVLLVPVSVIVLFLLLATALYIPPVQNYVVKKITSHVSETTGLTLRMERVRLAFPLDLALIKPFVAQKGDTILDARSIRANVPLLPLLKLRVDIDGLNIRGAKINTLGLISNTQVKGDIGTLSVKSRGIDLRNSFVRINTATLDNTNVSVLLCDTAAQDTSSSETTAWKIVVDNIDIANTTVRLRMPGDSMRIAATVGSLNLKGGNIDLAKEDYRVSALTLRNSTAAYDIPYAAYEKNFDPNHINLSRLNADIADIRYQGGAVSANVTSLGVKEKCGFAIDSLTGKLYADSTKISLSGFKLNTPYSTLAATATIHFAALEKGGKGNIEVQASGTIDRRDIEVTFPGGLPDIVSQLLPASPLRLSFTATGSNGSIGVTSAKLQAQNAFTLAATGNLSAITSPARNGTLAYLLTLHNTAFLKNVVGDSINIPHGTTAKGRIAFAGNKYTTNSTLSAGNGTATVNATYNLDNDSYTARINTHKIPLGAIIRNSSIHDFTAQMSVNGRGFDPFSSTTRIEANAGISEFGISNYDLNNMSLKATLKNCMGNVVFSSDNTLLNGIGKITALFSKNNVTATVQSTVARLDMRNFTGKTDTLFLSTRLLADIHANSDFTTYGITADIDSIRITAKSGTYPAKDLHVMFDNRNDSLLASLAAGDLDMHLLAGGNLDNLLTCINNIATALNNQITARTLDQDALRTSMPNANLYIKAGNDNPISNLLRYNSGYTFKNLFAHITTSPDKGLNGHGHVYSFNTGALLLDTIGIKLYQDSTGLKLKGLVNNTSRKNPYIFKANINGYIYNNEAGIELVYLDKTGNEGMNLGVQANSIDSGISVHLYPENPVIAFRKFKVNTDNYIMLLDNKIHAKVDLLADDGTGLKLYTADNDSIDDITMTINHLNLKELTSAIPYTPNLSGFLSGDVHLLKEENDITAAYSIKIDDSEYENTPLGNLGLEGTYIPSEVNNSHNIDAFITREDVEIADINGAYFERADSLAANLALLDFPVSMLNGFMEDMLGLNGCLNGNLNLSGSASAPLLNGTIKLDSVRVYSDIYGFNFNVQNASAQIKDSNMQIKDLRFYSTGDNPLVLNGGIDFSNLDNILLGLTVNARNFELINATQTKKSQIYGKVFSDINASIRGTLNTLQIRGKLDVLSNTNVCYVLQDSPLSLDNSLNELVTFVDFSDTTVAETAMIENGNIDMVLGINISDAARLHCDISSDKQSYVDIEGGGELSFKYTPQGDIILTGRYTATSGEMKYALPVIPLRTFYLTNGSYIEFTGDPTNPTLNIQAKERIKATVSDDDNSRSVAFDAGVSITKPLSHMGLEFTIEAVDDQTIQNQLAAMSSEQRNKLAISMLATGMYLEESNTSNGLKANNALNAFLQSEIQQIAGNALKTIDLSVSVEDGTSETGATNTDYSFRFAKRFWGNRVNVIIGGRVSTGEDARNDAASFIDNVSLEYRLDNSASRYIRLFYDHNTQDALEGQLTEMGAGVVLRRKTNTFGEIFTLWKSKKDKQTYPDHVEISSDNKQGADINEEKTNQK